MKVRINKRIRRALLLGGAVGLALGVLVTFAAAGKVVNEKKTALAAAEKKLTKENTGLKAKVKQQKSVEAAATLSTKKPDNWQLVLVNEDHPLDPKYKPQLTEIAPGHSVDSRIADDTKKMLSDAKAAGMKMDVISAYRSYDDQKGVFNQTMQNWVNQGDSMFDAYNETKKSVAVPGYSEHALGLALDIVSDGYQDLNDKQADTKEAKWLAENCYKYGFILRYPADKSKITKIVFEPWHYRYVGKDAAKEMTEKHLTLEEYLGVA